MSHEVESMAWAHQVPWHGLGNRVEGNVSIEDMLVAAGLDWKVEKFPCFAEVNGAKIAINRQALVRSSDNKILTISGDRWNPVQNREAMEFFREYCATGGATLETAGSLKGGKIIWALARVADGFTINGNDHVKAYILLVWTHIVGLTNTARITSVRVVCANTLAMAGGVEGGKKGVAYRQSHIRPFDVAKAKETVQLACERIHKMELEAQALQSLRMSEFDTVRILAKHFQPAETKEEDTDERVKALIDDPSLQSKKLEGVLWATAKAPGASPGNGWGVLNGVTYFVDHMAGREADTRLFKSWLGSGAERKENVRDELLEMVTVR